MLSVDGGESVEAMDADFGYGMFGCGCRSMGRVYFGEFTVHAKI